MYEFTIRHAHDATTAIIFGYTYNDACRRAGIYPEEWYTVMVEYVD